MGITHKWLVMIPIACLTDLSVAACNGDSKKVDDALNNDLSMAAQPYNSLDSVTAAERRGSATSYSSSRSAPVHHTASSSRSSSSSSVSSASSRSEPATRIEKHPGRDAAIGAGAGAIIGAATSKDKVKGGLIGAAAGGLLGAVIGNNVDKKKVPAH
jgi:hypothetical protein